MSQMQIDRNRQVLAPYFESVAASLPDPQRGLGQVFTQVAATPQERPRRHRRPSMHRGATVFIALRFVAAAVVLALAGSIALTRPLDQAPSVIGGPSGSPSPASTADPSPDSTPNASHSPARRVAGYGPALAWERVAWPGFTASFASDLVYLDGRFYMFGLTEASVPRVFRSDDGQSWSEPVPSQLDLAMAEQTREGPVDRFVRRFGDGYVTAGFSSLHFYGEDGSRLPCPTEQGAAQRCPPIVPGGLIQSLAVAPAGIVAVTQRSARSVVTEVLGEDVARGEWRWLDYDPPQDRSRAVMSLRTEDGTTHELRMEELGFFPDSEDRFLEGWFSRDGIEWARLPRLHGEGVMGTNEGFWAPDRSGLWFSQDGLAWERLGGARGDQAAWPGGGGLLLLEGARPRRDEPARLLVATPEGIGELPASRQMARRLKQTPDFDQMGVGPLGLVWDGEDGVTFSPDGTRWSVSRAPEAWGHGATSTLFAVGDDAIIALHGRCPVKRPTPKLCGALGAFAGTVPWEWTVWRGTVAQPGDKPD